MFTKKLKNHANAACRVRIHNDGNIEFISYSTLVIKLNEDTIECTGTYSQTTRKQIGWFLKEYAPEYSYHDMKAIAGKGSIAR